MDEQTGKPVNILLVDDNEFQADVVTQALREQHEAINIHYVKDGRQALDYLFHRGAFTDTVRYPLPHLVLLDLRIPYVDGLEVLKTIKESKDLLRIPVIIFTSSDADEDIRQAYGYHANSYIIKPVAFQDIIQFVDTLGPYWFRMNTGPAPE